jgi:hypothetical protein
MVSLTPPALESRHFCPISTKAVWKELPLGANVPSRIRTWSAAKALVGMPRAKNNPRAKALMIAILTVLTVMSQLLYAFVACIFVLWKPWALVP